jgi:hypothetical protein
VKLTWTRPQPGHYTCFRWGYEIIRSGSEWRIVKHGHHWDRVSSLVTAKALCADDVVRREAERTAL